MNNNQTARKLTENEVTSEPNESMSESDTSINRLEEIKTIEDKRKQYTVVVRINGIKERISNRHRITSNKNATRGANNEKKAVIQKVTNRYRDVNKHEVKFRGKVLVNMEYKNNKQKIEILRTDQTDITPLLGMDCMRNFKLTIEESTID